MIKKLAGGVLGGAAVFLLYQANFAPIGTQDAFFDNLQQYCGKAFEGKVTDDNSAGPNTFKTERLVMHVSHCSEKEIRIPFHVGHDRSRTWILTKTPAGISLEHDHRHEDGTSDELTLYGGDTIEDGWANAQSFPADDYSKDLFARKGIAQSIGNTWHMYIYPEKTFTYRLTREGRVFRVDFDLRTEVETPPAPWGSDEALMHKPS